MLHETNLQTILQGFYDGLRNKAQVARHVPGNLAKAAIYDEVADDYLIQMACAATLNPVIEPIDFTRLGQAKVIQLPVRKEGTTGREAA